MVVRYNKLWKLLVEKDMSKAWIFRCDGATCSFRAGKFKADLCKQTNIAPNIMTVFQKIVALSILDRICETQDADYEDIMEHVRSSSIQPLIFIQKPSH